jgi:hypothetical protein
MTTAAASKSRRRLVLWLLPLLLFAALAVLQTWPVAANIGSRVPGTATWAFDESTFIWNIWNFKHSLLDLHISPLHSDLIWWPLGIDLVLYTYNFFNAVAGMPWLLAFSPALASNLMVLLATFLSGLGAYLLALDLLRRGRLGLADEGLRLAALVAGVIYAFAANRGVYAALGHYNMVTTQWLPFYALYFLRTLRRPALKNAALAGLFFTFAALADMIFASFLALLSAILLLGSLRGLRERRKALLYAGIAALVAIILWSPVLLPIARDFAGGGYALEGWGESIKLSADAVGLVTPTNLNPVLGGNEATGQNWRNALRAVEKGEGRFGDINTVFLGWVTLALALLGAFAMRRKVAPWIWVAVVFGLLVLGPLLQINGRFRFSVDSLLPEGVTFPLPFALLHYIPFVSANRAPNRNSIVLMLALAVLAGFGVSQLLIWLGRRGLTRDVEGRREVEQGDQAARASAPQKVSMPAVGSAAVVILLVAAILIEHLSIPMPTTDATIPTVYRNIAAEPGDFAIMQLPLGWRNSFGVLGSEQTNLQYFQTAHGKPIIGGNISRAPAFKMDYFARIPLFKALTDLEMYKDVAPDVDAAARAQAGSLMSLYDVRYLVTTPPIPGRYPYQDTWQRTEQYALDVLPVDPKPVWEADGYRVYRINQPPVTLPFRLDLGAPGNEPYLGDGWDARTDEQPYGASANWATSLAADLYVPMPADYVPPQDGGSGKEHLLRVAIAPLSYAGAASQTVQLFVNDRPQADELALTEGWQTVEFKVNDADLKPGPNTFGLRFGRAESPREVFPDAASQARIGTTGVQSPVNLELHAFGEAFMTATSEDGQAVEASAGRNGYNVAVFDQRTGRLLDKRGFDTSANTSEADLLAAFLDEVHPGRIVALATKGAGTAYLTPAAVDALRSLGSKVQAPAELQGQSHAMIGVKGAGPGSASEVIAPDAYLRVAGDFRTLAAAVDWVELAK